MESIQSGLDNSLPLGNPLAFLATTANKRPGSWADWAKQLSQTESLKESGSVLRLAESFAKSAAISTEAATALLLWLGSVAMIQHAQIHWPSGIWQPAGLTMSIVEEDGVPIDAIVNTFIDLARDVGIDPICDTVKEGPAGLIARLESAGEQRSTQRGDVTVDSLAGLGKFDTDSLDVRESTNRGNARALIYPSGRALLSYLYDTPFFNTMDELIQHGNLNLRGKASTHRLSEVHMTTLTSFYQGALVTLTADNRVQTNMTTLLRQMMIFWPTAGARRHKRADRIDIALGQIKKTAQSGFESLRDITDGYLKIPDMIRKAERAFIDEGVAVRYTILNREQRIAKIAIAVAFWRICEGGRFEITPSDLAIADSILHMHEMGGRLFELAMSKGKMGHEFMRLFVRLLDGEPIEVGEEAAHASEMGTGQAASGRLKDFSVINDDYKLADEYRFVQGTTIATHEKRWGL